MLKKNNVLLVAIFLIICGFSGYAQNNNTTSPYSRFGIGDLNHYGYGRSSAMGGAGIGSRNGLQINTANPASYNDLDSLTFLFDFGIDGTFSRYKSDVGTQQSRDVNFRYFALNFPVTRWLGAGLGIQPFSDMGYSVNSTDSIGEDLVAGQSYNGEGSTSKAFFGMALSPVKNLSLGANLNYIFGRLNQNTSVGFNSQNEFYISKTEGTRLRDFTLTYGLQYTIPLKKDETLTIGGTFENKSTITVLHRLFAFKTITVSSSALTDTLQFHPEGKDHLVLPTRLGIGLSYHKLNKLEINADYYYAAWDKSKTNFEDHADGTSSYEKDPLLTNQTRISAGIEYIPEAFSIRSKFKRVKYRAGIHQENSYLKINDQQIKEVGISFGAGIPFPKSNSTANFAFEFGKKGTTNYSLVRQNYMKVSLYLNLFDRWFMKRQYD